MPKHKTTMKRRTFLGGTAAALGLAAASLAQGRAVWAAEPVAPNLVPEAPGTTPSYWCTWDEQSYTAEGDSQLAGTRHLGETLVFQDPGWITHYYQKVRKDLFVLYDGGWDIPLGVDYTGSGSWQLGSMELAIDKFPSCKGTPVERLRKLNEMTRAAGWRAAGIWVAAQAYGDGRDGKLLSHSQLVEFFRQRAQWSHQAGIGYWKVDFGARNNAEFRRLVTGICREEAPDLVVEHARTCGPVNDEPCPWDKVPRVVHNTGRFAPWDNGKVLAEAEDLLTFSSVLRTYDVLSQLPLATTLDRVAQLIAHKPARAENAGGVLLCEDQVYIGAGLGCAMGIMRGPNWKVRPGRPSNPFHLDHRLDAAVRAVRWQRIAPAFPAWQSEARLDTQALMDDWFFREGETDATWLTGHDARQGAPARVSRGMALPSVRADGEAPFVIASRHPNGAIAVAALPRASRQEGIHSPLADVSIEAGEGASPIGIFGSYRSLTLRLAEDLGSRRAWVQDLAGESAVDVTVRVHRNGRSLTLPGDLIHEIGTAARSSGDISDPGLVLQLLRSDT